VVDGVLAAVLLEMCSFGFLLVFLFVIIDNGACFTQRRMTVFMTMTKGSFSPFDSDIFMALHPSCVIQMSAPTPISVSGACTLEPTTSAALILVALTFVAFCH